MGMRRGLQQICAVLCVLALLSGCADQAEVDDTLSRSGIYFDTLVEITLYGSNEDVLDGAFALCEQYETLFSRTRTDGEVYQLNHADGEPYEVSDDTAEVIRRALFYSELSNGAFDITVGALSDLWNFDGDGDEDTHSVPESTEISGALKTVDYHNIEISDNTVTLKNGAQIDLGAIAKGYIADQLYAYLTDAGVTSGIINLGGNVLCVGSKPDGSDYSVGIKDPQNTDNVAATVYVSNLSAVTSGGYERYFVVNGVTYQHILDPSTGMPANSGLASATVICANSTQADALSTVCYILGEDKAKALIESLGDCEAVFITTNGDISYTEGIGGDGIPIDITSILG